MLPPPGFPGLLTTSTNQRLLFNPRCLQETIANVLHPTSRSRQLMCYWSSRGSPDTQGSEALTCQLAHPLCLVTQVQLRPFRACPALRVRSLLCDLLARA